MLHASIAIIGSGTMGRGIAAAALLSGRRAILCDIDRDALDRARASVISIIDTAVEKGKLDAGRRDDALGRLTLADGLDAAGEASFVIEAAPESLPLKKDIFARLEQACDAAAILATNTSSLSVTAVAAGLAHPERVAGMHFFNPAHILRLVEIVVGRRTSPAAVEQVQAVAVALGKTPVIVQDTPGFIVNRIARPFYNEALRILEDGVAGAGAIDRIMRARGMRMGPFELMDLIGNDVNYEVTRSLYEAFNGEPRYRPSRVQRAMVDAGMLGRKSGRGFYEYGGEEPR